MIFKRNTAKSVSLSLLIASNLPLVIENYFMSYQKDNDQNLKVPIDREKLDKYKIDIYGLDLMDKYQFQANIHFLLKLASMCPIVDINSVVAYFQSISVESEIIWISTLANRFQFIVTKYYLLHNLFKVSFNNYIELKKVYADLELGTKKFDELLIRRINQQAKRFNSKETIVEAKEHFNNMYNKKTPTLKFIFDNLPFDFFLEINTTNENKIKLFFQKRLAADLVPYLNMTKLNITMKQKTLGLAFSMAQFIDSPSEFIWRKTKSDKYYEYNAKDYFEEYLRIEGYNVYKTL